jgi:hypothetical protein
MTRLPKKRPWFQFYLSTAIVLMFVASGQLWLNICSHAVRDDDMHIVSGAEGRGTPFTFQSWEYGTRGGESDWDWSAMAIDLTLALAVFAGVAYLVRAYNRHKAAMVPLFDDTWTAQERRQFENDAH